MTDQTDHVQTMEAYQDTMADGSEDRVVIQTGDDEEGDVSTNQIIMQQIILDKVMSTMPTQQSVLSRELRSPTVKDVEL